MLSKKTYRPVGVRLSAELCRLHQWVTAASIKVSFHGILDEEKKKKKKLKEYKGDVVNII